MSALAARSGGGGGGVADRLVAGLVGTAGVLTAALLLWLLRAPVLALGLIAASAAIVAGLWSVERGRRPTIRTQLDPALLAAAIDGDAGAAAITGPDGALVAASSGWERALGRLVPPDAADLPPEAARVIEDAGRLGRRDGRSFASGVVLPGGCYDIEAARAGLDEDHLVWRLRPDPLASLAAALRALAEGQAGEQLARVGVMTALADADGRVIEANTPFRLRALGDATATLGTRRLAELVRDQEDGALRLLAEGDAATPLRIVHVPLDPREAPAGPALFLLLDEPERAIEEAPRAEAGTLHALLEMLPLGLALAERDGRFLFMNRAFVQSAALSGPEAALYPSDLVVKEDKAAVSDAVRRLSAGRAHSGDVAVRLKARADEPVALTIAGAKGLGEAAVLLSIKDNSEESKLKRQVAQATKMQAVGQLAGGVAHDFNNILTAIIGHCDLMLMRHAPGDSDYDDIQQVKHNSNRAAGLVRQLLAFSRQQTLRPQVLQLPDIIAEVSHLLKRLLGETVTLTVKHGRNLGSVRADPGQLEQVIINLAVNARDAMLEKAPSGGTLTIQTYAVSAAQVRELGTDILPVADYTALSVADTGTGIPPEIMTKIFEPFFSTKEVGKGTGLGLSTVYGIVKQSGGFIFADSKAGEGTTFTIYLPVHRAEPQAAAPPSPRKAPAETWGAGTILLVEDEDMVRTIAERALTRQGYSVLTAANGEQALEQLETMATGEGAPIDLLISDVMMPAMDGPTLVGHVRETQPALPVLFMSGYAEEQLRRSIDLDNVHFLAKPFSVQQLAEAAREALAKG